MTDFPSAVWRKSSRSDDQGGNCVEVAAFPAESVAVRDSKNPDGPRLVLSRAGFQELIYSVKAGGLDL